MPKGEERRTARSIISTNLSGKFNACAITVAADPVASVVVLDSGHIALARSKTNGKDTERPYNLANNPLRAANAPLARARVTHRVIVNEERVGGEPELAVDMS